MEHKALFRDVPVLSNRSIVYFEINGMDFEIGKELLLILHNTLSIISF
jgi:hypothetical protein